MNRKVPPSQTEVFRKRTTKVIMLKHRNSIIVFSSLNGPTLFVSIEQHDVVEDFGQFSLKNVNLIESK